ncbi:MAG TPA: hypothetical protein VMY99_02535 [Nevskiaceae bacterium]|nr:hypothetical protein [Nevskiaceae bacterium]
MSQNRGRETLAAGATAEPHVARRVIRHTAAKNAQAAIRQQFPGVFAAQFATAQMATQTFTQAAGDDDVAQIA